MFECVVCERNNDNKENMRICMDCSKEGFVFCGMAKYGCVGKGYSNKNKKENYNFNILLPSVILNNGDLSVDNSLSERITEAKNIDYCCFECYKNALIGTTISWYNELFNSKDIIKKLKTLPNQKPIAQKPFFDEEGKYINYLENLKT